MAQDKIQGELQELMQTMQNMLKQPPPETFAEMGKGTNLMPGMSSECTEYLKEWNMPENSVIISSYAKTGTAWCSEIVRNILYRRDEGAFARSKSMPPPFFLLEMGFKRKFDLYPSLPLPRLFFMTHVDAKYFNFDKMKERKGKMIYMYRNPKDQAVSWFHFVQKMPIPEEIKKSMSVGDWNEFIAKYMKGEHRMGQNKGEWYPDHILAWLKYKEDENFLLVEYESMKKDFTKEIRRIAKFLEVDLSEEEVGTVAHNCSIGTMKQTADKDKSGFLKINVRKGEVGGWKDQFTVAQSELMDKLIDEKLGRSGIKFTYTL